MAGKRTAYLVWLLVVFCLWPLSVASQPPLRLATVDNFPPFSFMEQGRLTGVDVDVVYEMASRLNLRIEIESFPWARVMEFVKDGSVDGGFAAFLTPERKTFCLYTGILHYEEFHIFVKKGREFPFSKLKDLYGKTIGKDIGVFVSQAFERDVKEGKIIVENVSDVDLLNLKKISLDRIDAMIGDVGVTAYHAKKLGMEREIVSLGPIHEKQAAYLILSKKSTFPDKLIWQEKMRYTLVQIWEDGTYNAIMDRYTALK